MTRFFDGEAAEDAEALEMARTEAFRQAILSGENFSEEAPNEDEALWQALISGDLDLDEVPPVETLLERERTVAFQEYMRTGKPIPDHLLRPGIDAHVGGCTEPGQVDRCLCGEDARAEFERRREIERTVRFEERLAAPVDRLSVLEKYERLCVEDEARTLFAARGFVVSEPTLTLLPDLLDEPDEDASWLIGDLCAVDGHALLTAQKKIGKSSMLANLVRSLADGDPFLDHFPVRRLAEDERVVLLDFEMSRSRVKNELRVQSINTAGAVAADGLRGRGGEFNILDRKRRAEWAKVIRDLGCRVLIIDPLSPIIGALGLDENDNSQMARLCGAMSALKEESGARELIVAHHMGHSNERGRGASTLEGWPDSLWRLVADRDEGREPEADAPRFLTAVGRDVALPETALTFDPTTKRLSLGAGNRKINAMSKDEETLKIASYNSPGLSGSALMDAAGVRKETGLGLLRRMHADGRLHGHKVGTASNSPTYWFPTAASCAYCKA